MIDVGALGARAVLDLRGRSRVLGSLWRHQPAVIVWLRHFACLFCKEQVAEMRLEKEAIESLGARLVFVGNGNTSQAQHFHDRHVPGCAIFTDPSSYTYRAIGARESVAATVGGTLRNGARAMRKGHFQYSFAGRPFQNGGVLIALPGDTAAYVFISAVAGDHPPNAEIMATLRATVAELQVPDLVDEAIVVQPAWVPPAAPLRSGPIGIPWPGAPVSPAAAAPADAMVASANGRGEGAETPAGAAAVAGAAAAAAVEVAVTAGAGGWADAAAANGTAVGGGGAWPRGAAPAGGFRPANGSAPAEGWAAPAVAPAAGRTPVSAEPHGPRPALPGWPGTPATGTP